MTIQIYVNGASQGKSQSGSGIVFVSGSIAKKTSVGLGEATNNQAELLAILHALKEIKIKEKLEIFTDSEYCIGVLSGNYRVKKNGSIIHDIQAILPNYQHEFKKLNFSPYKNTVKQLAAEACLLNKGEIVNNYLNTKDLVTKFVTIYTDASRNPNTSESSYAYYAKFDKKTVKNCGKLGKTKNSAHAEMLAIKQAIEECLPLSDAKGFFVNTDNLSCCHMLWPFYKTKIKSKSMRNAVNEINESIKNHGAWLRVKHVKAHTGNSDVRSYLNRYCDSQAKQVL